MKAAVLYEYNKPLVVEEVTLDPPKANEVKVRLAASGICASDLHVMDGLAPRQLPVVLGHEGAGIVEEVGDGVTSVAVGDHVIVSLAPCCGHCFYCSNGQRILCENMPGRNEGKLFDRTVRLHANGQDLNHFSDSSSFAEAAVVPVQACIKIRDDAPLDRVCLVACGVTTGIGAVINKAKVEPGSSVAVYGSGGVGLNVVQASALAGAGKIIAVDLVPRKLEWAREFGATHTIDASREDPIEAIKRITGRGADYAFEVIGITDAMEQAWRSTRPGGTCTIVGSQPVGRPLAINSYEVLLERRLQGCAYGSARPHIDIPMIVDLYMDGKIKLDELVTRTCTLDEINESIDAVKRGEEARAVIVNG